MVADLASTVKALAGPTGTLVVQRESPVGVERYGKAARCARPTSIGPEADPKDLLALYARIIDDLIERPKLEQPRGLTRASTSPSR